MLTITQAIPTGSTICLHQDQPVKEMMIVWDHKNVVWYRLPGTSLEWAVDILEDTTE